MKKQQGGILEITGPVIAGINTEEQKKNRGINDVKKTQRQGGREEKADPAQ